MFKADTEIYKCTDYPVCSERDEEFDCDAPVGET